MTTAARLSTDDPSFRKIRQLEQRLLDEARDGDWMSWERETETYTWKSKAGSVRVGRGEIEIWDATGVRLRVYQPDTDDLFEAVRDRTEQEVHVVIDSILADLERRDPVRAA